MIGRAIHGIEIRVARGAADIEAVRALFRQYEVWLDEPVCFEGFEGELAGLPGAYAPPGGELWLGLVGRDAVGTVGMRPSVLEGWATACEMKRLYVADSWRGRGFGRKLTARALEWAVAADYRHVVLETFGKLAAARALYQGFGFTDSASIDVNPLKSPVLMEKSLA